MSPETPASSGRVLPLDSVVRVLAMASDRTAMGLLAALDAAGYMVVEKSAPVSAPASTPSPE